jgi:hypothetical protein
MRIFPDRKQLLWFLLRYGILLALTVAGGCFMVPMPGKSYRGTLPPLTRDEQLASERLKDDVVMLAGTIGERNTIRYRQLQQAALYIAESLRGQGCEVVEEPFRADGVQVMNVVAEIKGMRKPDEIVVVGAHYDSKPGTPGANDNGSGVAAMLELVRHFREAKPGRTLRFVAFVNEEPPYFKTEMMGSRVHADGARKRGEKIVAMLSLETIGYYSDRPKSQKYPPPVGLVYPDTGNFIGFVGNLSSRSLVRSCIGTFRSTTPFPSEGLAAPEFVSGVGWSDQWAFWHAGYPAIMVTDTAPFRYPHYHEASDTPEKLDYERMARVVVGLGRVVEELVK